jgi:hypothetical protein
LAAILIAVAMQPPAFGGPATSEPNPLNTQDECHLEFGSSQYSAIRNKVPFLYSEPTDFMRGLRSKPSPTETEALRKFFYLVVRCDADMLGTPGPGGEVSQSLLYLLAKSPEIGGLAMLMTGEITYASYAMMMDAAQREAVEKMKTLSSHISDHKSVSLTCTIQSTDPFNGTELQYTIDLASGSATATRGAIPSDVQIGANVITFKQGDMLTMINRMTGGFSYQRPGTLPWTGHCEADRSAKF